MCSAWRRSSAATRPATSTSVVRMRAPPRAGTGGVPRRAAMLSAAPFHGGRFHLNASRGAEPTSLPDTPACVRPPATYCAVMDAGVSGLRRDAFLYESDDAFGERMVPFITDGLEAGDATVAVTTRQNISLLRDALGAEGELVSFLDRDEWYSRPAKVIAGYDSRLGREMTRRRGPRRGGRRHAPGCDGDPRQPHPARRRTGRDARRPRR